MMPRACAVGSILSKIARSPASPARSANPFRDAQTAAAARPGCLSSSCLGIGYVDSSILKSWRRFLTSSSDGSTKDLKQLAEKDNDNTGDCNDIRTDSDDDRNKHRYPLEMTNKDFQTLMGTSLQPPAGRLVPNLVDGSEPFIPQIRLHENDGRDRKRVLVLCTGGTLTMAPDPSLGGALKPVQGALSNYMSGMTELQSPAMPDITLHEYAPFVDSSDLGPADWKRLATDIRDNYWYYDGFVIITGTDTMAYCATALSFMLENLSKPVVFTGSQIPLCEPYNDARRNLVMAIIFASREHGINEVTIFFHDRLLRACRSTKVNTHRLLAFDSPNQDPLATIGITINENDHLVLPPAKGALRVHSRMDTRLLNLSLVPGFDDAMIQYTLEKAAEQNLLKALVLQLYGTGNLPSVKSGFVQLLADATEKGILIVASTQCHTGSVMLGHYAVGKALESAGVVSAHDMTIEAISCKIAYLLGRGDLSQKEVASLMGVSLRGEITPFEALSPPPLPSAYQRAKRKGKRYY